jgi:hypothetical protein
LKVDVQGPTRGVRALYRILRRGGWSRRDVNLICFGAHLAQMAAAGVGEIRWASPSQPTGSPAQIDASRVPVAPGKVDPGIVEGVAAAAFDRQRLAGEGSGDSSSSAPSVSDNVWVERDVCPPQGIPRPVPRTRLMLPNGRAVACPDGCGQRISKSDLYVHRFRCPMREGVTG